MLPGRLQQLTGAAVDQASVNSKLKMKYFALTTRDQLKGIVQRDLTGVETRREKSVLLSYSVGKFSF